MARKLTAVEIDEVSAVDKAANGKRWFLRKRHDGADETSGGSMDLDQVQKAVADVMEEILEPITKRLDDLEVVAGEFVAAQEVEETPEPVEKAEEEEPEIDIADVISKAVEGALEPLAERLDALEAVRGVRKSAVPTGKSESAGWGGLLL